jgi:hypothetical protein
VVPPIDIGPFPVSKPIIGGSYGKGSSGGSSAAGSGSSSSHQGALNDRRRRADYNSWRRNGDWAALDVTAMVLWIDECVDPDSDPDDNLCPY